MTATMRSCASIQTSSHTRLPVWREDINNIVGVLHMRNMSRVIDSQGLDRNALEREMEKPYFIPERHPPAYAAPEFPAEEKAAWPSL